METESRFMGKKIVSILVGIMFVFIAQGCARHNYLTMSNSLKLDSKEITSKLHDIKRPQKIAIYLSDETRKKDLNHIETEMGLSAINHANIGRVLEKTSLSIFDDIYEHAVIVDNKFPIPGNADILVELSFGNVEQFMTKSFSGFNTMTVELVSTFYNRKGEEIRTIKSNGKTSCQGWTCSKMGDVFERNALLQGIKGAIGVMGGGVLPLAARSGSEADMNLYFGWQLEKALQEAIENLRKEVVMDKG